MYSQVYRVQGSGVCNVQHIMHRVEIRSMKHAAMYTGYSNRDCLMGRPEYRVCLSLYSMLLIYFSWQESHHQLISSRSKQSSTVHSPADNNITVTLKHVITAHWPLHSPQIQEGE